MCGRYNLTAPPEAVRDLFGYPERPNFPPRENICPTEPIAAVGLRNGKPAFSLLRWGLVPHWSKSLTGSPPLINARAETAAEKPAFRSSMRRRRCLIPATGFYEWQKLSIGKKLPHHVRRPDGGLFAIAGLWERWHDPEGGEIDTATILTTTPNPILAALHDRMPLVIMPQDFHRWLDAEANPPKTISDLLRPAPEDYFEAHPMPGGGPGKAPPP